MKSETVDPLAFADATRALFGRYLPELLLHAEEIILYLRCSRKAHRYTHFKSMYSPHISLSAALVSLALLGASTGVAAGPSVAELISVCDRASVQGNKGKEAAACEWYAAPCACKFRGPDGPRWCVPDSESIDASVRKVVAELRRHPNPNAPTDLAVPEILERIYPCR